MGIPGRGHVQTLRTSLDGQNSGTLKKKRLYRFTPEGQKELNLLLGPIRKEILLQGQLVRNLKENKTEGDLSNEVSKLKKLRRTEIHEP